MVTDKPDISVILLCYRSEEAVWKYVEVLKRSLEEIKVSWEIILVGNYVEDSIDRTPEVVREIADQDSRIKSITKVKQGMVGWDMRSGLEMASGRVIAILDGDGQFPMEDVVRVYEKLKNDNLDLVKTYRETRGDGLYRRFISFVYNLLFKIMFPGFCGRDVNSKPKIFTEETLKKLELRSDGWFIDAEIMIKARRINLSFAEIPTQFAKQLTRASFVKPTAILEFIWCMIIFRVEEFYYWLRK